MITLAIRFPGGRYHATPWSAHVNEAATEWPPGPWRLLRALLSAWHRTAPELARDAVRELLEALSSPPTYHLPEGAAAGHTRHYMPLGDHQRDVRLSTTLVIDSFLTVPEGKPLYVSWDGALGAGQRSALARLAAGITYLGRSESWCDVELADAEPSGVEVAPQGASDRAPAGEVELLPLLAVAPPLDLDALETSTGALQAARQKLPPGARWVRYARPASWNRPAWPPHPPAARPPRAGQAVLWALDGRPAALLTDAARLATAVYHRLRQDAGPVAGALRVLAFPSDEAKRPVRLDRVAVWAKGGLGDAELDRVCRLGPFNVEGGSELVPLLLSCGEPRAVSRRLFGPGRRWESVTPAVFWSPVALGRSPRTTAATDDLLRQAFQSVGDGRVEVRATTRYREDGPRWLDFRLEGAARLGGTLEFANEVCGPLIVPGQQRGMGVFVCRS